MKQSLINLSVTVRMFFLIALTYSSAYGQINTSTKEENKDRPNFIIILADDLGFADLSMNGSKQIRTPNIDALAKTGVNFTQAYVSSAVCSPSRAGLITGKNQVEFGYDNNLPPKTVRGINPLYEGLPVNQKTIATRLKSLGYATGLIGKWHLGYQPQFHPTKRGFNEYWGYIAGGHNYFKSEPKGRGYLAPIESNYKTPQKITYITDDKGDECVDFISRHKNEPFFLFASFNAPHGPMQATEEDLALYMNIKDKKRRTYVAMVHRLDINVGRIMNRLKKEKLYKNTVVVFLSDNGGPVYSNASCNAPFNGQKGTLLEGGIHVPFIMNWPEHLSKGKIYTNPVSSLDIAPTFIKLAGGEVKSEGFTGVNLIPFLANENNAFPHDNIKWKFTISRAIRQGGWKLVSLPDRLPMLYHLPSDASEQSNVSIENLEITRELLKKLGEWDVQLPHSTVLEGAEWKQKQLEFYDKDYPLKQLKN